jgi:UDP:flavonoid glycosyltransferase YjiC (YdhE family)
MRVLLTVSGTRGDVQPLLALARALDRAGHRAVLAAPPNFETEALALGVDFRACGLDTEAALRANAEVGRNPARVFKLAQKTARSDILAQFEILMPLARQTDLVVSAGVMFAGSSVAEAAGVPHRYIAYTPDALRSAYHAPPFLDLRGMPRPINRWLWSGVSKYTQWLLGDTVNGWRRDVGLDPLGDVLGSAMNPEFALLAAAPELCPLPPDVALGSGALGNFWLDDDVRQLSAELFSFLERGVPPIYFGFGSMPDPDPQATTAEIARCVRSLGARGLIARGWAGLGADADLGPDILVVDDVPHAKLFPRVAAVVHHGGAGTTAAAILAGRAQLVIPHVMDQFSWGRRVHSLGVGPKPLARCSLNAARLRKQVAELLANQGYARRAQSLATVLGKHDGVRAAVRALELACAIHRAISEIPRASRNPSRARSTRPSKIDAPS